MAAEALHERQEGPDGDGSKNEWGAKSHRIRQQQPHTRVEAALVGSQRQHGRQDRTDAGRPSEGEGQTDDISAEEARTRQLGVVAHLTKKKANPEDAEKMEAEEDDDQSGHHRELGFVALDELAEDGGGGAQAHEHSGETENEHDRARDHAAPGAHIDVLARRRLAYDRTAEITEIRRH